MTSRIVALAVALGAASLAATSVTTLTPPAEALSTSIPQGAPASEADAPGSELLPLPQPDLSRLAPSLAQQIRNLEDLIRRRRASAEAPELAQIFATLGHLYTYYEMPDPALACYENAHRLRPDDPAWLY